MASARGGFNHPKVLSATRTLEAITPGDDPVACKPRMQRLFTAFPGGWSGAGLLLLRLTSAIPFFLNALFSITPGVPEPMAMGLKLPGLLSAALLLAGIWTPFAALLQVVTEVLLAFSMPAFASLHLTRAAIGLALAGLGPGMWSLDARLYGRKRIEI